MQIEFGPDEGPERRIYKPIVLMKRGEKWQTERVGFIPSEVFHSASQPERYKQDFQKSNKKIRIEASIIREVALALRAPR